MNNALKQETVDINELPRQTAVVISIKKISSKRARKKNGMETKEVEKAIPASSLPGFTSPVFKPKKHDLF